MTTETQAETMTQAEYGRLRGIARQRVSKLAQAGRVALDEAGRVRVAESDLLIEATARSGMQTTEAGLARQLGQARLRHEEARAEKTELEVGQLAGTLCDQAGARRAGQHLGATARSLFQRLPARIAAELATLAPDVIAIEDKLAAEIDELLTQLADQAAAAADEQTAEEHAA